jgi:predicted metal-dependent HD superfamily phosphohydrolase
MGCLATVYVRESDVGRIKPWCESIFGSLDDISRPRSQGVVYRDGVGSVLELYPGIQDTDFTMIFIRSPHDDLPFASDADLARAAFRSLGVEARCSPEVALRDGTARRHWSVSGNGETCVTFFTPWALVEEEFSSTVTRSGLTPRSDLLDALQSRYSEPHRTYHTLLHLSEAYGVLAECVDHLERPDEAKLALWFHDAIYDTHRHDNEERSADWARDELLAGGAAAEVAARVHSLVLATKHRDVPEGNDARLLVDADLSILAAPPDRFAAYERQIRREYDWVPEPQFREAREKFLRGMLARSSIFNDAAMRERHEAHARRNIEESLRRIGTSP